MSRLRTGAAPVGTSVWSAARITVYTLIMIILLGPESDAHIKAVHDRLGDRARVVDFTRFPEQLRISVGEQPDYVAIDGEQLRPSAVYVRDFGLSPFRDGELGGTQWRQALVAHRERSDLIHSVVHRWEQAGVPIYNPPSSLSRVTKPYQLGLLAAAGLPVPETRWTNDPDEVRQLAAARRIAYKPVAGGAHTRELEPCDLDRLALLSAAPVCFQELLPGEDIRAYVLDGEIVCATTVVSDQIDYRGHETAIHVRPVDDELGALCTRAAATLGLRFAGIDLKLDADGNPKILEANSSPMFLGLDARGGTDILGALCAALARQ